jgi:hypothetical protein
MYVECLISHTIPQSFHFTFSRTVCVCIQILNMSIPPSFVCLPTYVLATRHRSVGTTNAMFLERSGEWHQSRPEPRHCTPFFHSSFLPFFLSSVENYETPAPENAYIASVI